MDDFFGVLLVIFGVVVAMAQRAKQGKKKASPSAPVAMPMAASMPDMPMPDIPMSPEAPEAPEAQATMLPPRAAALLQRPVMAPRVQTTMDTPELYAGSMNADTDEGEDPCHPQKEPDVPRMAPVPVETPGLRLNFSGDSLMQALVMQEVLKRPCQRRG